MDFTKLNATEYANKGADLQVLHPATNEPLDGVIITLLGEDSAEYKKRIAEARRKMSTSKKRFSIADAEAEAMENRIAVTVGWEGISEAGKELECTPENVRYMYEKYGWLVEQVDKFVMDRANFFPTVGVN